MRYVRTTLKRNSLLNDNDNSNNDDNRAIIPTTIMIRYTQLVTFYFEVTRAYGLIDFFTLHLSYIHYSSVSRS